MHCFNRARMNVVREDDRSGTRLPNDSIANRSRPRSFPIQRVYIPKNDLITELVVNPLSLARSDRSIRWSHQSGALAGRLLDYIICLAQLSPNAFIRHLSEIRMRPTVVRYFMAFTSSSRHNVRYSAAFSPITKKVALIRCLASKSSSSGVNFSCGPSSNVIAM